MNKAILIGNLTKDPEFSTTPNGKSVCKFTLAINRGFGDKKVTDYIPIVVWEKRAELCRDYLIKGFKVGIVGRIEPRSYEANDGTKRYVTDIIADEIEFLQKIEQQEIPDLPEEKEYDDLPF